MLLGENRISNIGNLIFWNGSRNTNTVLYLKKTIESTSKIIEEYPENIKYCKDRTYYLTTYN